MEGLPSQNDSAGIVAFDQCPVDADSFNPHQLTRFHAPTRRASGLTTSQTSEKAPHETVTAPITSLDKLAQDKAQIARKPRLSESAS